LSPSPKPPKLGGVAVGEVVGVDVATLFEVTLLVECVVFLLARAGDAIAIAVTAMTEVAITVALFFRFISVFLSLGADKFKDREYG
jgi:hypothetical protein